MRSKWKLPVIDYNLLSLVNNKLARSNSIKRIPFVYSRNTVILPEFVDLKFNVYNGKVFKLLKVSKDMVGFKFGFFVFTKKLGSSIHKSKILKSRNKVKTNVVSKSKKTLNKKKK